MTGPANRRRRQPEDAHHAGKSRSVRKQQTNPARTTWIRFDKVRTFPESFLTPRRNLQNEGRTEGHNKRQDVLIEAMKSLATKLPSTSLDLAGAVHKGELHRNRLRELRKAAEDL